MSTKRKGFTLVEIMLVVAIISLLAAIAVPNLIKARDKTQINKCMSNARLIREAIDQWATDRNKASNDSPASNGSDCLPYIKGGRMPICAADEVYTLSGTITNLIINCGVHGDLTP